MALKRRPIPLPDQSVDLGENPVNAFQAREYARESSPSSVAVMIELTENARDNATNVELIVDVESSRQEGGNHVLLPRKIICRDNGTGLTHREFLERFCGAYSDSEAHHEVDRAGRNGVGTKTYTSIAERVTVKTTTGRPTDGLDEHREQLLAALPDGLELPRDGEPDSVWRTYEFRLHNRRALPPEWSKAEPQEMGTGVELSDIREGTELLFEMLIERLSYNREWLRHSSHKLTVALTGNVPATIGKARTTVVRPWAHPSTNWLTHAAGNSLEAVIIFDPTSGESVTIPPAEGPSDMIEFDFRVVGKGPDGQVGQLHQPAMLLEICGALPYAPNIEGLLSARTLPLLTFLGLEHASSIGAFCNSICGYARINSLRLKQALRNNKTTLASGPGSDAVRELQAYLGTIVRTLHRAWYNATRSSQDEAAKDAVTEAQEEVNLALNGVNRNPFKGGQIDKPTKEGTPTPPPSPVRRHRWECGACGRRWLAEARFTPKVCAEESAISGPREGCGSDNIGLAKNQPRIGDCRIRIEQLGDRRLPSIFQFEKESEDIDLPVVLINLTSPRYIELRGTGSMSGQAQRRLKQYLVDVSLVAIADYYTKTKGSDFVVELGDLYFNRMLRFGGIKQYESEVAKLLSSTSEEEEQQNLALA
jgi:Histidine kinase-, DNA gyrase B-, and HSP90-like ATPase